MQTVYHTDGDFRVTKRISNVVWIEHRCPGPMGSKRWGIMWSALENRGLPCEGCGRSASPGLQVVFLFMKDGRCR